MKILARLALTVSLARLFAGCGSSQPQITVPSGPSEIIVRPGQSIQTAVDRAQPGDTIIVEPDVYGEAGRACVFNPNQTCAVSVIKDAISLIGRAGTKPVVLTNAGGLSNGIEVGISTDCAGRHIQQSRVAGFVVRCFNVSGIVISCVDRWQLHDDRAINDGLYGLYASFAADGHIDDSTVIGAARAGIDVGLSHDVHVDDNISHDNVMGFEIREDNGR